MKHFYSYPLHKIIRKKKWENKAKTYFSEQARTVLVANVKHSDLNKDEFKVTLSFVSPENFGTSMASKYCLLQV